MSTRFVFFGTPELSAEILDCLKKDGFVPSLIVTNGDRPQGRNMALTPPPVKLWAIENNISYLQPEDLCDPSFLSTLHATRYTLFIVVAYGKILPKTVLEIPEKGTLNIHYSLLPKYRGASPIESAILHDDRETGVSIMLMDEKMDHGPIVARSALQITNHNKQIPNNTQIQNSNIQTPIVYWPPRASELRHAMNVLAGRLLVETIPVWITGKINVMEQKHGEATYTKKFTKADGEINLSDEPYKNFLKICAFDDSIGTYFFSEKNSKQIRVLIKKVEYKDGKLTIVKVVPEGKTMMSYEEFRRGLER